MSNAVDHPDFIPADIVGGDVLFNNTAVSVPTSGIVTLGPWYVGNVSAVTFNFYNNDPAGNSELFIGWSQTATGPIALGASYNSYQSYSLCDTVSVIAPYVQIKLDNFGLATTMGLVVSTTGPIGGIPPYAPDRLMASTVTIAVPNNTTELFYPETHIPGLASVGLYSTAAPSYLAVEWWNDAQWLLVAVLQAVAASNFCTTQTLALPNSTCRYRMLNTSGGNSNMGFSAVSAR
jgi:hypothetical protein